MQEVHKSFVFHKMRSYVYQRTSLHHYIISPLPLKHHKTSQSTYAISYNLPDRQCEDTYFTAYDPQTIPGTTEQEVSPTERC